jgi:hypothetical protein
MRDSAALFSLMRWRRAMMKGPVAGRVLTVALAATMLFALTPCCEVSAAPAQSAAEGHDHGDHHGGGHPQGSPLLDPCLAWVDNNFNALTVSAAQVAPERDASPVLFAISWIVPLAVDASLRVQRSCHSPPSASVPLYLRIERLLL